MWHSLWIAFRGELARLVEMCQAYAGGLGEKGSLLFSVQELHERGDEPFLGAVAALAERTILECGAHIVLMVTFSPSSIPDRTMPGHSTIARRVAAICIDFLYDIGQHLVIHQCELEGVVALRQLPGMQWAETARADELMPVFHIGKSLKFPTVHRVFHIFEYHKADRAPLASIRGA